MMGNCFEVPQKIYFMVIPGWYQPLLVPLLHYLFNLFDGMCFYQRICPLFQFCEQSYPNLSVVGVWK